MLRLFRDFSVALKLNLLLCSMTLAIIVIATQWVSSNVRHQLESQAMQDLEKINALVLSMFEAYNRSLAKDVERNGRLFASTFGGQIELLKSGIVPQLMLNGKAASSQIDHVDAFCARSGTVATIFQRQGDDFLRTATSLKMEDGTRAIGTSLGNQHPARASLVAGNPYTGKASLFGRDYITHYLPAKDASGQVVGAFFVGLDMAEGLKALKKEVLSIKIGDTGYVYALDAGAGKGTLTVHPSIEGQNILATKDSNGREFVREIIDKRTGAIHYDWISKDEKAPRDKIAVFTYFPAWNWAIVSGSYLDEFTRDQDSVVRSIVVMALAILLSVCGICYLCTRKWVTLPLREIMQETARIASGDLTISLRSECNDELGRMKQSIGKMAESLKQTIAGARRASGMMLDQSLQLVTAAEQVASSSEAQSDSASGMAASVEQMSVSINQVAQHARDAHQISTISGETATESGAVIQQATSSMERIAATVREASSTISDLGKRSQDITSVVQVIREISDQTNLLALNAAIEAARAGEQGRGFAVVADEVRKLAERTTVSTQSIGEMIGSIQTGAERAIGCMQDGVAQVEQGCVLAVQAGQAIEDIHGSSRKVIDAVSNISNALSEQNVATQAIAQCVEGIAQKAEANHSASRISAQSAQALREMALALDKDLGYFRVS